MLDGLGTTSVRLFLLEESEIHAMEESLPRLSALHAIIEIHLVTIYK